jgi:hypothetical protein
MGDKKFKKLEKFQLFEFFSIKSKTKTESFLPALQKLKLSNLTLTVLFLLQHASGLL